MREQAIQRLLNSVLFASVPAAIAVVHLGFWSALGIYMASCLVLFLLQTCISSYSQGNKQPEEEGKDN